MAKLTDDIKQSIKEFGPAFVATVGAEGMPSISPKGSFRVLDDDHVAFADIASPRTVENLRNNPGVAAIVLDKQTRHGCRIWGKAQIHDSGKLFDDMSAEYAAGGKQVKHVVVIEVGEVLAF